MECYKSNWGKLAIHLFCLFVWLQIIWAIQAIIWPQAGFDCYYDGVGSYAKLTATIFLQHFNLVGIGFLLIADRGGIIVWNVTMVAIFFCWYAWRCGA